MRGWPWRARWLAHWAGERGVGLILVAIAVAMAGGLAVVLIYDPTWLTGTVSGGQSGSESRSTTIRNVGLIGGGAMAILIAYWRSRLAQQDLLNKRYQEGAAMLGNEVLAVRLAGIYALERLAKDHPWEYHIEVMKSLCAFARNPTRDQGAKRKTIRPDVQAAMDAICACHARQLRLEKQAKYGLDLHGADLKEARLQSANLVRADLTKARLQRATLIDADLTEADLEGAFLIGTDLARTDLTSANLTDAVFTVLGKKERDLRKLIEVPITRVLLAWRLTQRQLNAAFVRPGSSLRLDGLTDPETGDDLRPPPERPSAESDPSLGEDSDD